MHGTPSEKRQHKRTELAFSFTLRGGESEVISKTKSLNISDGGALVSVPVDAVPEFGSNLHVCFSVPRKTPNTYMLEDFLCSGRVVRHQPLEDNRLVGVALEFSQPLQLALEV